MGNHPLAVVALVKRLGNQILMLERTPGDNAFTGWCFPGGKVDPGETAQAAVLRELREETGLSGRVVRGLGDWRTYDPKGRAYALVVYEVECDPFAPITLSPREHRQYRWVLLKEALQKMPLAGTATRSILGRLVHNEVVYWPLMGCQPLFPDEVGLFGVKRRFEHHSGLDLYCELGTKVVAIESGRVVGIEDFTGPDSTPPSPWWNPTQAVLVDSFPYVNRVLAYGEITVDPSIKIGQRVSAGDVLGVVDKPVLRHFKGRPTVMLHMELLGAASTCTVTWPQGQPCPAELQDPAKVLERAAGGFRPPAFDLSKYDGKRFCDQTVPRKDSDWWAVWGGKA